MKRTGLLGILSATLLVGCGTLGNLTVERTPYGGVTSQYKYLTEGTGYVTDLYLRPFVALDVPATVVGDTLTLPITIVESIKRENERRALTEGDERVQIAESAFRDEQGLKFGTRPSSDLKE